jgi:ribonuclease HI
VRYWAGESAQYCGKQKKASFQPAEQKWQAPRGDVLKINCDGAFSTETKTGGWGFVVRDQYGDIRGAGAGFIPRAVSAAQAEMLACEAAAKASAGWGISKVVIESDSTNLIKAMRSTEFDRAHEGIVYRDLRLFMNLSFNYFELSHVPRTCNKLAHEIAAYGATWLDTELLWPEPLPSDVLVWLDSLSAVPSG